MHTTNDIQQGNQYEMKSVTDHVYYKNSIVAIYSCFSY